MASTREIGSIEPGKRADLILVARDRPHLSPDPDPWSTIVYAARGTDVSLTMVDGRILVRDFTLMNMEAAAVADEGRRAAAEVARTAGLL